MRNTIPKIIISLLFIFQISELKAQTIYPEPFMDQSYISPSPDAQAFEIYGTTPTALYEGLPAVGIPIYVVKCGSLNLPLSLSYNYSGLFPLQDASWVGLGWTVNAGGVITRMIEGNADSSQNSGYNYDQYNISDTLLGLYNYQNFLANAYDNSLAFTHRSYDLQPDIFDYEFSGGSGKFIKYAGKPYQLLFDKQIGISWPSLSGSITITTADGIAYTFGAKDTTTNNVYGGDAYAPLAYFSAWHLTMVVSADKKDTITLNYAPYAWIQYNSSYQASYTVSTGTQADLGADPTSFLVSPSIKSQVLQSIVCRNTRVSFIPDTILRTDVTLTYPRLAEIDIIDSLSGITVKKNRFSYEYFGQTSVNPQNYERLKLKRFNSINTQLMADSLTYSFKYINEYGSFPSKGTNGIDNFGYYNGQDTNQSIMPVSTNGYYYPAPPSGSHFGSANRISYFGYSSYGALDTLVYPSGGYSIFQYEQNTAYNGSNILAPGIGLQSVSNYTVNSSTPVLQKNYTYLLDDGLSNSGTIQNPPYYYGYAFQVNNGVNTYNYTMYRAPNNGPGAGGTDPMFYYKKVTETIVSGNETHKSDHYFSAFPGVFLDARQTTQIDYVNTLNTNLFTPVLRTNYSFASVNDTNFFAFYPNMSNEAYNINQHPPYTYTYTYGFTYTQWSTYWTYPVSAQTSQYDLKGDSIVNTINYNFNTTTRNLTSIQQSTSDGQTVTQKFKYPEDYTSALTGNMVAGRVLSPVIEKQTWMKRDASDSSLISGEITLFDQTIFKPTSTYAIETTSPIASLNNETKSGNSYSSLLSDSRYILKTQFQYDANSNPSSVNQNSDINISLVWDYRHSKPIAEVKNAAQADIAFTSFEADGKGNWTFTGTATADATSPTGNNCYNIGQTSGNITKSGLTSTNTYTVSYWIKGSSALSISGTMSGYPIQGKTINGWTYFEHKITGQTTATVSGTGTLYIDELRLYPYSAQMTSYAYSPLIGKTSQCDPDNRITYYQYDGFGRLKVLLDQDHNIIKTIQYHYNGETVE
jgi:YD repeat-containing protein